MKRVAQPSKPGSANFWFHDALCLFLTPPRDSDLVYHYNGSPSIKDAVEACGVPHVEVGLILMDGQPIPFKGRLEGNNSMVQVFPPHDHPPVAETMLPAVRPAGPLVFILDVHLGMLARFLRMMGFDCLYQTKDPGDAQLARLAGERNGILLSRDIGLLKRGNVRYGYFLRSRDPREQLREVIRRFAIARDECRSFTRCLHCNDCLIPAAVEAVAERLPESVLHQYREFQLCNACDRIFWKGTHYLSMKAMLAELYEEEGMPEEVDAD